LRIRNLVKNHCLAKSINDASWYQFRKWLEYFGVKFGRITVAVNPAYTSQACSSCGTLIKKSLSTRTHVCECGFVLDRDWNAAINIMKLALSTTGHVGTWVDAERLALSLAEGSQSIDPNASANAPLR
jgi:putative transposase